MIDELNLYQCDDLIQMIEAKAEQNDGELSEEDTQAIVKAQITSLEKLGKLIRYILYLEGFSGLVKMEIVRLLNRKKTAENRIAGIKKYLLPYIEQRGPVTVGTHRISIRKSKGVILEEGFANPQYCETVTMVKPDKGKIKESIESGIEVQGAILEERQNIQIR